MGMFCYQCQEATKNVGCDVRGVCGKDPDVAALEDLLTWVTKGVAHFAVKARELGIEDDKANLFVAEALFSTITNVSFDPDRFAQLIQQALSHRDRLQSACEKAKGGPVLDKPQEMATWKPADGALSTLIAKGHTVGVKSDPNLDEDVRSLRELLIYGLKGAAAYAHHAEVLGGRDEKLLAFLQEGLVTTTDESASVDDLVGMVLRCGEAGVTAMALLDKANTDAYGNPEPTEVNLGVRSNKAILISGHDLRDLAELLEQTQGKGVDVYTHGEMLPAQAYPAFKKYEHFAGNYGGAWWQQDKDFASFGGAILMTTNCITKPRDSYKDRIFTTGLVGWPGVAHIPDREGDKPKDFGPLIDKALASDAPKEIENGKITVGFAHATVLSVADKVIDAVKGGDIKRFVVMAGCDGRHKTRGYYTDVANELPKDSLILTAGCAKYRYNKLDLGDIGGIPRVLDAGQCNDSYSLVVTAQALAKAFNLDDINDLPISYDIAWYEQKAVIVLLALLFLGVKHIRLGPTLPAFLSPNVAKVLVDKFDIKGIGEAKADANLMMAGN